jgi:hypothetical protein
VPGSNNIVLRTTGGDWQFGTDGQLTVPGQIRKDGGLYLNSSGTGVSSTVFVNGTAGSVILRTDDGTTNKSLIFDVDGVLTLPNSTTISNDLAGEYSNTFLCVPWGYTGGDAGLFSSNNVTHPYFNPLIATVTVGWYVSGPLLNGVKEITEIVEQGNGDRAFIVDITDGSTWADVDITIPYRFYTPDYTLVYNGTRLTVDSNEWNFTQAGDLTIPGNINEKAGNGLEISVHNNRNNDGTPGSALLSLTNNDAVNGEKLTSLSVGAYGIELSTDYTGVFTGARRTWEFDRDGILTFPDATTTTGKGITIPVNESLTVNLPFNDGISGTTTFKINAAMIPSIKLPGGNGIIYAGTEDNANKWSLDSANKSLSFPDAGDGVYPKILYSIADNVTGMQLLTYDKSIKITAAQTSTWTFDNGGKLTLPADSSILTNETALNIATHSTTTYTFNQAYWEALNANVTRMFTPSSNAQYFACTVTANQNGTYTVDVTGIGNGFNPGNWFKIPGNELGGTTPANDIQITVATINGGGGILTTTITGTAVSKQWNFGTTGSLTFPDSTVQTTAWTNSIAYANVTGTPTIPTSFSSLVNNTYTASLGTDGELSLPTNAYTEAVIKELDATALVLFAQKAGANIKLLAGATSAAGAKQWLFNGTTGTLALPAAGKITNGVSTSQVGSTRTIATNDSGGTGSGQTTSLVVTYYADILSTYAVGDTVTLNNGDVRPITSIVRGVEGGYITITWDEHTHSNPMFPIVLKTADYVPAITVPEWQFGTDSFLTFPNGTRQSTAYDGNLASAIKLGFQAGYINQSATDPVAVGNQAGRSNQGAYAVSVGANAGAVNQGARAIAIGVLAGDGNQGAGAIAIGSNAGNSSQGANAIAIGYYAGLGSQPANSIVLNATGSELNGGASGFHVAPVRNQNTSNNILTYDTTTKEIAYRTDIRVEGTWTVTTGTNNYSFTAPSNGTYTMWVRGNIPNGIIVWNATVTITNTNVPVVGQQFAWVYDGAGNPLDFTSIPSQIVGTPNTILRSYISSGTTNVFIFGIANTSGASQTVYYGYTKI